MPQYTFNQTCKHPFLLIDLLMRPRSADGIESTERAPNVPSLEPLEDARLVEAVLASGAKNSEPLTELEILQADRALLL